MDFNSELLIWIVYIGVAILFIFGLKIMYSKVTAGRDTGVSGSKKAKKTPGKSAATIMAAAENVIIVPGYGMAVAQAQHDVWELARALQEKGVRVSFAIHPVAGRMPGHMDVLLADAGVPYDVIHDLDDINDQFPNCDVALVVGANDVVNPAARNEKVRPGTGREAGLGHTSSPIYGIPVLDADKARNVVVIKRGQGTGFSGIENLLFAEDNTRMCYGDARDVVQKMIADVGSL